MKLLRSGLPILMLGAVIIFAVENWSPTVPLVILGAPTIALPLGVWLVIACGLGGLTILAIALCLRFISPSEATVFSNRPSADSPVAPRDSPRKSQPFWGRSPAKSPSPSEEDDPQRLEDWEEFSRPRYDWEEWQSRSARSPSTATSAASPSNSPQSSWFSATSPSRQARPPKVTEVEFEQGRPSASRFTSPIEDWDDYEQTQKRNEWGDRPSDPPSSQDPSFQESPRYSAPTGADNYQSYDDQRDDYQRRGYPNDDYRDRADRDRDYPDRDYPDRDYPDRDYPDRDYRGNSAANRDADYRDDQYYRNDYGRGEEPYRPAPDQNEYGYDQYDDPYQEPYATQAPDYGDPDGRNSGYQDVGDRDTGDRDTRYEDVGYSEDYPNNPGYGEQQEYYAPNAGVYGGVAEGGSQEQFIIDYGDEAALDEFEATLDQSTAGQYRWQRPGTKQATDAPDAETRSTVDEDLEALNDWDNWEDDPSEPPDADEPNGGDVEAPRPIREVQRHPIAIQKSGSVYSYRYGRTDAGAEQPTPEDSSRDTLATGGPTPNSSQTPTPEPTAVTESPDFPDSFTS